MKSEKFEKRTEKLFERKLEDEKKILEQKRRFFKKIKIIQFKIKFYFIP